MHFIVLLTVSNNFFQFRRSIYLSSNNNYDTSEFLISSYLTIASSRIFSKKKIVPSLPAASGHYVNAFLTVTQRRCGDLANKVEIFCSIAACLYVNRGGRTWPVGKVSRFLWVFVASKALRPAAHRPPFAVARTCFNAKHARNCNDATTESLHSVLAELEFSDLQSR